MNTERLGARILPACLLLLLVPQPAALSLQSQDDDHEPTLDELSPFGREPHGSDPQQELIELFGEVEQRLVRINALLLDASAGDTSKLEEVGESGMDELFQGAPPDPSQGVGGLLRVSEGQWERVIDDIDRIIELAQQMGTPSSSGSSSGQSKPGESPLDGRPEHRIEKTQSPEDPTQSPEPPQQSDGEEPKSPKSSDDREPGKPASKNPDSETGPPLDRSDDNEKWGELPIHVRDVFRAEGGPSMPPQYRDWIDSYYRRLNDRSGN